MKTAPAFLMFLIFMCGMGLTACTTVEEPPVPQSGFTAEFSAGDKLTGSICFSTGGVSEAEVISPDTLKGMRVRDTGREILVSVGRTEKSSAEFPRLCNMTAAAVLRSCRDAYSAGFVYGGSSEEGLIFRAEGKLGSYTLLTDPDGLPRSLEGGRVKAEFKNVSPLDAQDSPAEPSQ